MTSQPCLAQLIQNSCENVLDDYIILVLYGFSLLELDVSLDAPSRDDAVALTFFVQVHKLWKTISGGARCARMG